LFQRHLLLCENHCQTYGSSSLTLGNPSVWILIPILESLPVALLLGIATTDHSLTLIVFASCLNTSSHWQCSYNKIWAANWTRSIWTPEMPGVRRLPPNGESKVIVQ
jgi:hypothetical protein